MARSGKTVFPLLGRTQDALLPVGSDASYKHSIPVFHGFQFDSHSTTLSYSLGAGGVKVELYFSSPITGDSVMRQSLPASYLEVKVSGGGDVDIYVDVNGSKFPASSNPRAVANLTVWATHDRRAVIKWDYKKPWSSKLQSWAVSRQTQMLFTEDRDRAEWGTLFFTTAVQQGVSYQSSDSSSLRKYFASSGNLRNKFSKNFRNSEDAASEPVFAFSKKFSLGGKGPKEDSILFTLALSQDPIVQFAGKDGYQKRRPLWTKYYRSEAEMVSFHYHDYAKASATSEAFSKKVQREATALVDETYADIVALSARQVLGATYFTGTLNQPILNLKEISSDGNFQTVDVIFPAFPFFLYLNKDWLGYLLEPLLEHQKAGLYPNLYSIHDLGSRFPNATGHPDGRDEAMPVEECGNMLIMALAFAQALSTSDGPAAAAAWINRDGRYKLWKQWTQFLVEKSLIPARQLSTDDFAGQLQNQTNLAIKGMIGIRAMSRLSAYMADAFGGSEYSIDEAKYRGIADAYMPKWQEYSDSRDGTHAKLAYHWQGSWGSLYNAYADALLCFHIDDSASGLDADFTGFVPHKTYRSQSRWYDLVHQKYGLPLDSRHLYTKSDWELWIAAISSQKTRLEIVDAVGRWVNETTTDCPFSDLYDTESGGYPGIYFKARPVVGGHFSVLALEGACGGRGFRGIKKIFGEVRRSGEDGLGDGEIEQGRIGGQTVLKVGGRDELGL